MTECLPIIREGYHYIEWIRKITGDCIYTPLEQSSFWVGISSIGFWIVAQFPQVIENYRNGDASSLSPFFLFIWAIGDGANLIGAIMTHQLATQVLQAIYFLMMDVLLTGQWLYYYLKRKAAKKKKKKSKDRNGIHNNYYHDTPQQHHHHHQQQQKQQRQYITKGRRNKKNEEEEEEERIHLSPNESPIMNESPSPSISSPTKSNIVAYTFLLPLFFMTIHLSSLLFISYSIHGSPSSYSAMIDSSSSSMASNQQIISNSHQNVLNFGRKLHSIDQQNIHHLQMKIKTEQSLAKTENDYYDQFWPISGFESISGYVIGSFSAFMYISSRLPQIFKNCQRRSTDGLSPILFICAFLGNMTYSLSIVLFSTNYKFLLSKLPWIIGSAGVMGLDVTVLTQFILFKLISKRDNKQLDTLGDHDDDDDDDDDEGGDDDDDDDNGGNEKRNGINYDDKNVYTIHNNNNSHTINSKRNERVKSGTPKEYYSSRQHIESTKINRTADNDQNDEDSGNSFLDDDDDERMTMKKKKKKRIIYSEPATIGVVPSQSYQQEAASQHSPALDIGDYSMPSVYSDEVVVEGNSLTSDDPQQQHTPK